MCLSGDEAGAVYVKLANYQSKVCNCWALWLVLNYKTFSFFSLIFLRAARHLYIYLVLYLRLDSKHEAANAYAGAAHCYKKTNTRGSGLFISSL